MKIRIPSDWYRLRHVAADGDCLFHAVAAQTSETERELRELAWRELLDHETQYANSIVSTAPYTSAIAPIRVSQSWHSELGDITPCALACALEHTFFVLTPDYWYYIHPREGRSDEVVYLYLDRAHYSILDPTEAFLRWEDAFYTSTHTL